MIDGRLVSDQAFQGFQVVLGHDSRVLHTRIQQRVRYKGRVVIRVGQRELLIFGYDLRPARNSLRY
jgi:hypothetical protein